MLSNRVIDILEDNDIQIISNDSHGTTDYVTELEFYSPAGEDFIMTLWHDNTDAGFIQAFKEYMIDFDPDEHAEMWAGCRGRIAGVPDSIRELIDDADAINDFLEMVSDELSKKGVNV